MLIHILWILFLKSQHYPKFLIFQSFLIYYTVSLHGLFFPGHILRQSNNLSYNQVVVNSFLGLGKYILYNRINAIHKMSFAQKL